MSANANEPPSTPAYVTQREELDPGLREHFDALVQDYRYYAFVHHTRPFVSYKILADLVKVGWRRSAGAKP